MIIAFGHRQGVGKSTAARFLKSELQITRKNSNIHLAGFADKVKDVASQLFAWGDLKPGFWYEEHYQEKNQILPKLGKTPRELWIGTGNGIRQATGYDSVWLDFLINSRVFDLLIITDLRFPGEADGIRKAGGKVIKIERDSQIKVTDGADDPLENYQHWDQIIKNNGSLNEFHRAITELGKSI